MSNLYFIFFAITLFVLELIYFRIARATSILDQPNNRSLHNRPTIRGGGIIFPVAILIFYFLTGAVSRYFMITLIMITVVGMLDDIKNLSRSVRFGVQVLAMLIVFYELNVFDHAWWIIILLLFIASGTINAYNFMDGINGITGGYSLVVLAGLYFINSHKIAFVDPDLLKIMMLALLVFSFFNFRTKAVCFAGDVGSLTIGFTIIYLILKLTMASHNYIFILLLAVYGTDTVLTVIHRLILRQNVLKAHRLHLYQVIISVTGIGHLPMTLVYMGAQIFVNGILIHNLDQSLPQQYFAGLAILIFLIAVYVFGKRYFYKQLPHDL